MHVDDLRKVVQYCMNKTRCRRLLLFEEYSSSDVQQALCGFCDICDCSRDAQTIDITAKAFHFLKTLHVKDDMQIKKFNRQLADGFKGARQWRTTLDDIVVDMIASDPKFYDRLNPSLQKAFAEAVFLTLFSEGMIDIEVEKRGRKDHVGFLYFRLTSIHYYTHRHSTF